MVKKKTTNIKENIVVGLRMIDIWGPLGWIRELQQCGREVDRSQVNTRLQKK